MENEDKRIRLAAGEKTPGKLASAITEVIVNMNKNIAPEDILITCIGTDRCIGDSLGPFIGTILDEMSSSFEMFGTLGSPVHALNADKYAEKIKEEYANRTVIAIDAAFGRPDEVGEIIVAEGPLYPSAGMGRELKPIGDISVKFVVCERADSRNDDYEKLSHLHLFDIYNWAKYIAFEIIELHKQLYLLK